MKHAPAFALDIAGRLAPNTCSKAGLLTVHGTRRWVALDKGTLTIHADESASGTPLCQASMIYVEVIDQNNTPQSMHLPTLQRCELRVTVEPDAINHAIDRGRASMIPTPWPTAMLNRVDPTTQHTGDVQRVVVSLFADSPGEKMAWLRILNATSAGRRDWARVRHELKITKNAVRESLSGGSRASIPR